MAGSTYTKIGNEQEFRLLVQMPPMHVSQVETQKCQVVTDRVVDPVAELFRDMLTAGTLRSPELRLLPRGPTLLPPLPVDRCPLASLCEPWRRRCRHQRSDVRTESLVTTHKKMS
jgi:hypothetical protein